jgi:hypothetical protein
MKLTEDQIAEFQLIWEKQFGVEISKKDALESATKLLVLMKAVYQPIPSQGHESPSKSSSKQ